MLPLAYYLLKVIICSGILYLYYWLLLRNKVFHKYNRFYLLAAVGMSLIFPLLKIGFWQPTTNQNNVIKVLQAVNDSDAYMDEIILQGHQQWFSLDQMAGLSYLVISLIILMVFFHALYTIFILSKKYPKQKIDSITLVNTLHKSTPFSFFQYIFWNQNINLETESGQQIFKHELAHVNEKHSYDKIFINIVLIIFWCNPFFWLMRRELNIIHEFIADKDAVEGNDTAAFAQMILQASYPQHQFQITNNFFYSPIKRRLLMLTKNNNPKVNYFGRIMALPLLVIIFAAFSFKVKSDGPIYSGKKVTVMIDAGHGGQDNGALGVNGILEKDIALAVVKKIKSLNSNDAINIVLTRDNDIYQTVQEKAALTKKYNADLFISVHMDAGNPDVESLRNAMSVWVAKDNFSNTPTSKILASSIINEFSKNYPFTVVDVPMQRQTGIYVLQEPKCPAALIETGFISDKKFAEYVQTENGKETIAKNLLNAINIYLSQPNVKLNVENKEVSNNIETQPPANISVKTTFNSVHMSLIDTPKNKRMPENIFYVLDGKIIGSGKDASRKIETLKPGEIKTMNVFSGKSAIDKYGEKAKNGAIEIFTKSKDDLNSTKNDPTTAVTEKKGTEIMLFSDSSIANEPIFNKTEIEAEFPGGQEAYRNYLMKNLDANLPKTEGWKPGSYTLILNFIVRKDGKIVEVETKNYPGSKTAEHCINLFKNSPNWIPAKQNGHAVNSFRKQPITIVVTEPENKSTTNVNQKEPLYIVDGKEMPKMRVDQIKQDQIENIRVFKDKMATTVYGQRGKNGVVVINLKPEKTGAMFKRLIMHGNQTANVKPSYLVVDGKEYTNLNFDEYMKKCGIKNFDLAEAYDSILGMKKFGEKAKDGAFIVYTKRP